MMPNHLIRPEALALLPPVSVVEVALIVPAPALLRPKADVPLPPVIVVDVTLIVPVLALFRP